MKDEKKIDKKGRKPHSGKSENCLTFSKRLQQIFKEKKISQETAANALEVTRQTFGNWLRGDFSPDLQTLSKIADYFNVSVDYLLGRTETPTLNEDIQATCKTLGISEKSAVNLINMKNNIQFSGEVNSILESSFVEEVATILLRLKASNEYLKPNSELIKSVIAHSFNCSSEYHQEHEIARLIHGIGLQPVYAQMAAELMNKFISDYCDSIQTENTTTEI